MAQGHPRRGQQQQRQGGPPFRITSFEIPERVKPGEDFTIVAVVMHRAGNPPFDPQEVIFEADGTEIGQNMTDSEGRASLDHSLDREGTHSITAQVRGVPASRVRRTLAVKAEEPKDARIEKIGRQIRLLNKRRELVEARRTFADASAPAASPKPDQIVVSISGERGDYLLGITVVDADGACIPFARNIRIIQNQRTAACQADADGTIVLTIREASHIKVIAGGTEALQWEGFLDGQTQNP